MKKTVIIVAIITFLAVAGVTGKVVYDKIYTSRVNEEIKQAGLNPEDYDIDKYASPEEIREQIIKQETERQINEALLGMGARETAPSPPSQQAQKSTYLCVDNPAVTKRGYIVIHGAGGPDAGQTTIKNAVSGDPKYGGFLYFTYDADKETLDTIASRFVSQYNAFVAQGYDKIIIYGQSSGGVIASHAANRLGVSPDIEIHTLASPLNGYKFGSAAEQMAQQLTGFNKEIALGLDSYAKPPSNVIVYHHKTIEDQTLRSFCGSYASLCSPSVIQDNNVPGSSAFDYPNDTHDSIINTVVAKTLSCRK